MRLRNNTYTTGEVGFEAPRQQTPELDWYNSYPVRRTLEKVGDHDGTDGWIAKFTATLFEVIEEIAEAKERYKVNRFLELRSRWENAYSNRHRHGDFAYDGKNRHGGQLPVHLLREMVDILPIPMVAHSLYVTEDQVRKWMWPQADLEKLAAAAAEVADGAPITAVAEKYGIHRHYTLTPYLKAHRIESVTQKSDGRRLMPLSVRERIIELRNDGLNAHAIVERINEESGVGIKLGAVKMTLSRAAA